MFPVARGRQRRPAGQGLVEFALVIPIFLVLLFGLFDGGRIVYMNSVLSQAAREAARVASVEASHVGTAAIDPSCNTSGGPVCPASFSVLLADALAAANRMVAPFGSIPSGSIFMSCDALGSAPTGAWTTRSCVQNTTTSKDSTGKVVSDVVSVRVELTFAAITPIVGQLIPSVSLSGFATMVIN